MKEPKARERIFSSDKQPATNFPNLNCKVRNQGIFQEGLWGGRWGDTSPRYKGNSHLGRACPKETTCLRAERPREKPGPGCLALYSFTFYRQTPPSYSIPNLPQQRIPFLDSVFPHHGCPTSAKVTGLLSLIRSLILSTAAPHPPQSGWASYQWNSALDRRIPERSPPSSHS